MQQAFVVDWPESVDEGAGDVDGVGVEGVDADDCVTVPFDEVG